MDERDSERGSLHLSAFVAGALVGAGMALLLTPQPGAEVRGMLRRYASKSRENVVEHGRDALQTAVDRGKEYMEKGKEAVRSGIETGKEAIKIGTESPKDAGKNAEQKKAP